MAIPVSLALLQSILIAVGALISRIVAFRGHCTTKFAADFLGFNGIVLLSLFALTLSGLLDAAAYTMTDLLKSIMGSVFYVSSQLFVIKAFAYSKGSICQAFVQLSSVFYILLELAMDRRVPSFIEAGILVLAILGVTLLSIKDS